MNRAFLNGEPVNGESAGADALRSLATVNYGHFTSMQVRNRAVRGLDLHLQRLRDATLALFDVVPDEAKLRRFLRDALDATGDDASLRATVFARSFDYRRPLQPVEPDVLVTVAPPIAATSAMQRSIRVKSYAFVRPVPHIKHVGTFPLFHYRRLAMASGFDDALFIDGGARTVEGTVWNLGFWDGSGVVWPAGPALRGTAERLLQLGLEALGVAQASRPVGLAEAGGFPGAFAVNANGLQAIAAIDEVVYPHSAELLPLLTQALETQPWQPV